MVLNLGVITPMGVMKPFLRGNEVFLKLKIQFRVKFSKLINNNQGREFSANLRNSADFRPPGALRLPQEPPNSIKKSKFSGFPPISSFSIPVPDNKNM